MKVTVTLEHSYGHPTNAPSKLEIIKALADQLPKAIRDAKGKEAEGPVWFRYWSVTGITVD